MREDKTTRIENDVKAENKPRLIYLARLWKYVFTSAKAISLIYLGLLTLLSLLRPVLAMLWGRYIDMAAGYLPGGEILPLISLVTAYHLIGFVSNVIWRYTCGWEDIERLDLVQINRFQEKVNSKIYKKFASVNPEYWEVPKINDTADRVMDFMSDRWGGVNRGVVFQGYLVLAKAVSVVSVAMALYIFNPLLCVIVLAAPLPSLYALLFSQKLRFKFVKENSKILRRAGYFQDVLLNRGAKEVKTMGLFDFFFAKWSSAMDEYTAKEKRLIRNQTLIDMSNNIVTSGVNVGATVFAITLMASGKISVGALGACISLVGTLMGDTKELIAGAATFLSKKNEAALFYDLMGLKDKTSEGEDCGEFKGVEAINLSYRYPMAEKYALEVVSLKIRKGEKVAFVGENGAGKTTMVKLLTATLSPSEGELYINGRPSEVVSFESRYDGMSAVTQNPARYTTLTIGENIRVGDPARRADGVAASSAMEFAGLGGYDPDTLLGKDIGGTELSGGEWQKIAVARADYRNRDFIILDEPTSNLDPFEETEVFKKYMELARDKTVIFVTHRISVAALAERIVVFENGAITEDGSHGELLARGGVYARLYNAQSKWYNR